MLFAVCCLVALVAAQPPTPLSPTTTPTPTISVSPSPDTASNSATVSGTPMSASVTPSITPSISASASNYAFPNVCPQSQCATNAHCGGITGALCCSGKCSTSYTGTVALGGACDNTDCTKICSAGFTCSAMTGAGTCVVPGIGIGCTNTCSSNSDCAKSPYGPVLTCNSGKCGYVGVSVGGTCNDYLICATGLSCSTAGKCTAIPSTSPCAVANQPYDPSVAAVANPDGGLTVGWLDGACATGLYCASSVCATKIASGNNCDATRGDVSCQSGVCNDGKCVDKFSVGQNGACTNDWACQATMFCSTGDGVTVGGCQPKVGVGARCSNSFAGGSPSTPINKWCQAGLFCSHNNGKWPVCRTPNVAPGGACVDSDECSMESSWGCLAGTCSGNTLGNNCQATTGVTGNTTACGNHGSYQYCKPTVSGDTCTFACAKQGMDIPCVNNFNSMAIAAAAAGYLCAGTASAQCASAGVGTIGAYIFGADSADTAATFACCNACTAGAINQNAGEIMSFAAIAGKNINCATNVIGSKFTGTTLTNVCGTGTGGQTVATPGSTLYGQCKVPSSGVATLAPSVALLVALVASLALLL